MSKILEFLGIETRSVSVDPTPGASTGSIIGIPTRSLASDVTLDRALSLTAVYRAIDILSIAVAQLKIDAWRSGVEVTPPPFLVRTPDVNQSLSQFLKRTVVGLAGTGNAYWHITRNSDGMVSNLEVLNPLAISIEYDKQGNKQYRYANTNGGTLYKDKDVKHLRYLEVPGHTEGVGPIQANTGVLSGSLDLRDFASSWHSSGGVPTGVLSSQQELDSETAARMKAQWQAMQQERSVAVLGKGLDYSPILISPKDAQFIESQQFSVTTIAQMFGIPATYLLAAVEGNSMTYTNLEQIDTVFLKYTLMRYLIEIEDALSSLLVRGQTAKFNVDGFLRPDAKTQADIHKLYFDMNVISAQEIRDDKGWSGPPPKPKPVPVAAPIAPNPEEAPNV